MRPVRLTLPVQSDGRVPEVVADLVARHALHRVRGLQGVQDDAVLLHLPPVHLERRRTGETGVNARTGQGADPTPLRGFFHRYTLCGTLQGVLPDPSRRGVEHYPSALTFDV